jgi:hypothetical protein
MMKFDISKFFDEQKCYDFLVEILHPEGLRCPQCKKSVKESKIHRHDRAPILNYRCPCGRIYNIFAGTEWQGTHYRCSVIVCILRGIAQGIPSKHLAEELDIDFSQLLERRHRMQDRTLASLPKGKMEGSVFETDEMYQNAGEKRKASH